MRAALLLLAACAQAPSTQRLRAEEGSELSLSAGISGEAFRWSQLSPTLPRGVFSDPSSKTPVWTAPIVCEDTLIRLSVRAADARGEESSQDVEVMVSDSAEAVANPSVSVAKETVLAGESVRLSVDARGPGCLDSVAWRASGGVFSDAHAATTTWRSEVIGADTGFDLEVDVSGQTRSFHVSVRAPSYSDLAQIFDSRHARCAVCHVPNAPEWGDFDLATLSLQSVAVKRNCGAGKLLVPGDPDASIFVKRLRFDGCRDDGNGSRMPYDDLGYFDSNPGERVRIESWVKAGAKL